MNIASTMPVMSDVGSGNNMDELYGMEDFLPTPMEALQSPSPVANEHVYLSDAARRELARLTERFIIDPDTEMSRDNSGGVIVKFNLRSHQVPALRLVIPRSYPNGMILVDRAALDLDAFFFDDLQNVIHDRLARPGLRSITDFLDSWESTVRQYQINQQQQQQQQQQMSVTSFDDIFSGANFDDILN